MKKAKRMLSRNIIVFLALFGLLMVTIVFSWKAALNCKSEGGHEVMYGKITVCEGRK